MVRQEFRIMGDKQKGRRRFAPARPDAILDAGRQPIELSDPGSVINRKRRDGSLLSPQRDGRQNQCNQKAHESFDGGRAQP
jgi:hypothetical protein